MNIPIFSLKKQHDFLKEDLEATFQRVMASGGFVLGPEVEAWEREFSGFLGCQHSVGVANGSDALLVALQALGVGPGDEVILPTYTFFSTAGSVVRLGAKPVFVDSAPCCYNLSVAEVASVIGPKTKAILAVHLFGQAADMEALIQLANRAGVPVVEDVAQSLGAKVGSKYAGTLGTLGCFSFFPTKNLGALGEGGMIVTGDAALAEKVRKLRVHGAGKKYYHEYVGGNYRLHSLQAAFLRVKLPHLNRWLEQRGANAELYRRHFSGNDWVGTVSTECVCQSPMKGVSSGRQKRLLLPFRCHPVHTFNQFVVRIPGANHERDQLRELLQARGVSTEVYYPRALHVQDCFRSFGYRQGQFPWAEKFSQESLALPIYPELEAKEIEFVATQIKDLMQNHRWA